MQFRTHSCHPYRTLRSAGHNIHKQPEILHTHKHKYIHSCIHTKPWIAVCKMAAGKSKRATHITTLKLQDGSLTTNLQDTLLHMIQKLAPDDNQEDDTETHSQIRTLTQKPLDTEDDEEFTLQEVTIVIQGMGNNKAPGGDGIPNEV